MIHDVVIMAGGSGTRLWPASRRRFPKQFLPGPEGRSFFRLSVERALATGPERVLVIAGKDHVRSIVGECAAFSPAEKKKITLLAEPEARNTAAAVAWATVFSGFPDSGIPETDPDGRILLVMTSDHVIEPLESFREAAEAASGQAGENLVVFGIAPSRAETGYGYIEAGESLSPSEKGTVLYRAASFREKPDRETAERYRASGRFFWNSGMFCFSGKLMREEFRKNAPEILSAFSPLSSPPADFWKSGGGIRLLEDPPGLAEAYRAVPSISLDYAIAEKCARTVMVRGSFRWTDAGSWDEYATLLRKSPATVFSSPDGSGAPCFVDSDIPVALASVEDLVVVIRSGKDGQPPAALIARKGETQRVRDIVELLKREGRTDLL